MNNLRRFVVAYPNGMHSVEAEDLIDALERAQERWGTPPSDVWSEAAFAARAAEDAGQPTNRQNGTPYASTSTPWWAEGADRQDGSEE